MKQKTFILTILLITTSLISAQTKDKVLDILKSELDRNFAKLKTEPVPAYYIAYRVHDVQNRRLAVSFSNLTVNSESHNRIGNVDVRVGDYKMDNTREIKGFSGGMMFSEMDFMQLIMNDNSDALKTAFWEKTDAVFKTAIQRYAGVQANTKSTVESEDKSDDFSQATPEKYVEAVIPFKNFKFNESEWIAKLKSYGAVFVDNKDITNCDINFDIDLTRRYFVSSEGTMIAANKSSCRIQISAVAIAEDGMELPLYKNYFANDLKDLPSDAEILKDVAAISTMLSALKQAPTAESYSGPAIMTSQAAGVFFHEIFGHRIEGSRLKKENDAQTFKKKVGQQVLPSDMAVYFDPSLKKYGNLWLNGSYIFDDEGVRGKRVDVVKNGILSDFLMCRTPIDNFPHSNGHGRASIDREPVSRQSNMVIESSKPKPVSELRTLLLDELKQTGKEYGYVFDIVSGGFTQTGRYNPNAFNVQPLVVYKIFTDGRPDELVRGVDVVGTPLSIFAQIIACGNDHSVFNGFCGAESGTIPVSCASPSLFVKVVETQKKAKTSNLPPMLPRPVLTSSNSSENILDVIKTEVDRNIASLKRDNLQKPFFISYAVADVREINVNAQSGALRTNNVSKTRTAQSNLYVGDYQRTNASVSLSGRNISMDNTGIAVNIWRDLDNLYKRAAESYETKLSAIAQKQLDPAEAALPDMEQTAPTEMILPPEETYDNREYWADYVSKVSEVLNQYRDLILPSVSATVTNMMVYEYNTEGTRIAIPTTFHVVGANIEAMTDDGQRLSSRVSFIHRNFKDMPDVKQFTDTCRATAEKLLAIIAATKIEDTYTGPVLFENQAVAHIFRNYFLNNYLIAARKPANSMFGGGNDLEMKKDRKVISRSLTVKALSGMKTYNGHQLEGYYPVDMDGVVPADELTLIENGILRNMLVGRSPTLKFAHSTGHRIPSTYSITAPGNALLSSTNTISSTELKQKLLDKAKEEDLEYAYIVRNHENNEVYRIYVADGREELVRNVIFPDLNIKAFNKILGASSEEMLFNYYSGRPFSIVAPAGLLFEELDVSRNNNINARKPFIVEKPLPVTESVKAH